MWTNENGGFSTWRCHTSVIHYQHYACSVRDPIKYASCMWTRVVESGETKFSFSRISRIPADGGLNFLRWWIPFFYSNLYRKGSIIAEFKLTFKTSLTAKEAMAPLKQETADGKLGSLDVDSNSLKLKDNNQGKWVEPWIHGISTLNIYGRWV